MVIETSIWNSQIEIRYVIGGWMKLYHMMIQTLSFTTQLNPFDLTHITYEELIFIGDWK